MLTGLPGGMFSSPRICGCLGRRAPPLRGGGLLTLALGAGAVRCGHRAPLPRASAVEEQIVCGLLERCGELPVGEAGLAEFAEGLVAGEHEEEVERPGGRAVA